MGGSSSSPRDPIVSPDLAEARLSAYDVSASVFASVTPVNATRATAFSLLRAAFCRAALSSSPASSPVLTEQAFNQLILLPSIPFIRRQVAAHLFSAIDTKHDNVLDWDEFSSAFAVLLAGTDEERLLFLFYVIDGTRSGACSRQAFSGFARHFQHRFVHKAGWLGGVDLDDLFPRRDHRHRFSSGDGNGGGGSERDSIGADDFVRCVSSTSRLRNSNLVRWIFELGDALLHKPTSEAAYKLADPKTQRQNVASGTHFSLPEVEWLENRFRTIAGIGDGDASAATIGGRFGGSSRRVDMLDRAQFHLLFNKSLPERLRSIMFGYLATREKSRRESGTMAESATSSGVENALPSSPASSDKKSMQTKGRNSPSGCTRKSALAVSTHEVIRALSCCSRGTQMEQMEFCFGMFDVDGDGVLSAPELESMMQALQAFRRHQEGNDGSLLTSSPTSRASTARQPRDSSPELIASPVDGCISQTAFYRWASQNPDLKRLISSVRKTSNLDIGVRPLNEEQEKRVILQSLRARPFSQDHLRAGQTWYILCEKWFRAWAEHVDLTITGLADGTDATGRGPSGGSKNGRKSSVRAGGKSSSASSSSSSSSASTASSSPARRAFQRQLSGTSTDPGPINNFVLLRQRSSRPTLRPDVMHGKDFRIVNERVWSALAGWYGGGPPLQRSVIQVGKSHLELEVYPIVLRVNRIDRHGHPLRVRVASGAAEPGVEILMSRIASFVDMRRAACKMLKMDPRAVRVWDCSNGERGPQRLVEGQDGASAAKLTLEDLNFADGQLLLFEEPLRSFDLNRHHGSLNSGTRNGGGWPRGTYAEGQVYTPDSAMDLQQRRQQQHHQRASSSPSSLAPISGNAIENTWKHSVHGVTGLQNLGNTCYMNSSLQCLGNVRPLVEYFRSNAYIADLNNDSVMGSKMAELADTYGALVMDGWGARGSRGAVAPRYFKKVLGRFRENFAGYTQEDAQEFLAAMFDGLGEDLNRVVDKPYVEQPDSDGRPDLEVAKEWWTNQQKRENSIVQALFTGQFKSRWRCQCCGFESARFEPYTFLQLPLPDPIECSVSVTLHYFENSRVPLRCTLRVPINGTAADILEAVCDAQLGTGADDARCAHLLPFKPENLLLIHRHGPKNLVIGRNMSTRRLSDSQIMVHCYQLAAKSRAQGEVAHDEASGGEKDDGDNDRNANDPEEGDDGHRATARQSSLRDEHDVEIDRVVPHTRVLAYFEGQLHSPYPGRVVSESATKPGAYAIAFDDGDFDGQVARSHINTRVSLDVKPIILTALHREFEIVTPYFWNRLRPKLFGEAVILRIIPGDTTGYELYKTVWKHTRYLFPHMKGPVVEGSTMDIDIWRSVPSLEDRAAMVAEYKTRGSEDSENDDGGGIGRTSRHGQSPCLMLGDGSPVLSWGFCLRRVNESGTMCPTTPWTRGCLGTELADGGDGIHILEGSHVAIDWEPSVRQQMHDLGKCLEIHKSVERCRRADKKALSLYECVDKFVSPEKLDGNDQVYCSSCKSHQDGTKCVNMFRNPPVLVVHLKRFKFNQYVRGKISRLVTFPVENADLRFAMPPPPRKQVPVDLTYWRFLGGKMQSGCDASAGRVTQGFELAGSVGDSVSAGESREANAGEAAATKTGDELPPPLYDCIGVVNHAGSLGAGHYTAFCKNPYDGKWRHFNDSLVTVIEDKNRIVTNKAYLLFYMRQDLCGESMAPGFDYRMATPKELEKRLALRKKLKGSGGRCAIS